MNFVDLKASTLAQDTINYILNQIRIDGNIGKQGSHLISCRVRYPLIEAIDKYDIDLNCVSVSRIPEHLKANATLSRHQSVHDLGYESTIDIGRWIVGGGKFGASLYSYQGGITDEIDCIVSPTFDSSQINIILIQRHIHNLSGSKSQTACEQYLLVYIPSEHES